MPIYDFRCPDCGMEFEVSRSRNDAGNAAYCPLDGKEATRIFSTNGFVVKAASFSPTPAPPGGGAAGHGHSHGPFGHSHGPGSHTH